MQTRRQFLPRTGFTLLASVALYAGGCSRDEKKQAAEEMGNPALADVIYEGSSNDEGLQSLLDERVVDDANRAPAVSAPAEGAALTSRTTFAYQAAPSGPEQLAQAQGEPMNGPAFFLVFSSAGDDKLLRVFTTETSYTPDADAWDKLKYAGEALTLTITLGIYEEGRLTHDGGPFASHPLLFSISP